MSLPDPCFQVSDHRDTKWGECGCESEDIRNTYAALHQKQGQQTTEIVDRDTPVYSRLQCDLHCVISRLESDRSSSDPSDLEYTCVDIITRGVGGWVLCRFAKQI